jgi:peroxiredoxin Q/BCP
VEGVIRSTFVVAPDRTLARVFPNVKVDGHADAVLAAIRQARDPSASTSGKAAPKAAKKRGASAPAAGKTSAKAATKTKSAR